MIMGPGASICPYSARVHAVRIFVWVANVLDRPGLHLSRAQQAVRSSSLLSLLHHGLTAIMQAAQEAAILEDTEEL